MAYANSTLEYRKASVAGASPVGLIVLLYDGALRFMDAGTAAMGRGDLPAQNAALQKAQRIVIELMGALDMRRGGEVSTNLMALYAYVLNELVRANVEDDPSPIENAARTMEELRAGWAELEAQQKLQGEFVPGVALAKAA